MDALRLSTAQSQHPPRSRVLKNLNYELFSHTKSGTRPDLVFTGCRNTLFQQPVNTSEILNLLAVVCNGRTSKRQKQQRPEEGRCDNGAALLMPAFA